MFKNNDYNSYFYDSQQSLTILEGSTKCLVIKVDIGQNKFENPCFTLKGIHTN